MAGLFGVDYSAPFQAVQPMQSAVQGLQIGDAIFKSNQEAAALQAAQDRQRKIEDARRSLMNSPNPTAQDYTRMASLLPEKDAASMRANWDMLSKDRQQKDLLASGQVMAAFNSGSPEIGLQILRDRAEAAKNSGDAQQAKAYDAWAKIAEINPKMAARSIGVMVSQLPGGDKVIEGVTKLGSEAREEELAPLKLSEQQSSAQKAAVAARFAESNAVQDLAKKGWDIQKIQSDMQIAKMNANIAAANAATAKEGNALKRQELQLKVEDMIGKRDDAVKTKAAEVESARFNIDNMLNTAEQVLKFDKSVVNRATGPVASKMPTLTPKSADFEALIETLGSQAFMSQLPNMKGMGALSNAEGEKLQASLQNLSTKQSSESLMRNVQEAQRLLLKVRKNVATRYGVPDTAPDTPAGNAAVLEDLLKKYGGK